MCRSTAGRCGALAPGAGGPAAPTRARPNCCSPAARWRWSRRSRPGGPAAWSEGAGALDLADCACTGRVRAVIALRLDADAPARGSGAPRPGGAGAAAARAPAAACTARTVDAIWHAAGDTHRRFQLVHQARAAGRGLRARRCCIGCATPARTTPRRWRFWTAGWPGSARIGAAARRAGAARQRVAIAAAAPPDSVRACGNACVGAALPPTPAR